MQTDQIKEILKRTAKYIIEGFAVAVAAYYIPQKMMAFEEIVTIALTAAATFAILDVLAPSIASSARMGAGFGIGLSQVGANLLPASVATKVI